MSQLYSPECGSLLQYRVRPPCQRQYYKEYGDLVTLTLLGYFSNVTRLKMCNNLQEVCRYTYKLAVPYSEIRSEIAGEIKQSEAGKTQGLRVEKLANRPSQRLTQNNISYPKTTSQNVRIYRVGINSGEIAPLQGYLPGCSNLLSWARSPNLTAFEGARKKLPGKVNGDHEKG